ncbi:transmembrane protein 26-like [Ptychodera flava]|uniref:transmembrane protein 26-like n=1 Tax=Ptychodera flava TaxID=63121 RepID=UPI003969DDFE
MEVFRLPIALKSDEWVLAMQQLLLGLLIVGRWILPKGEITRDQLSQLLLVYIGIAADILEFSTEALKEEQVKCNEILIIILMGVWSWSLLQFCFVLTATKVRKPRMASQMRTVSITSPTCHCCETEVWAIMLTLLMQDGPYLTTRMYLLVRYNIDSQMMVFFTCKNLLVVLLQLYRLIVLRVEKQSGNDRRPDTVALATISSTDGRGQRSGMARAVSNVKTQNNEIDVSAFILAAKNEERQRVIKSLENLRQENGNINHAVEIA